MSVSSIQLLLFACAVELTLLALLTQSTFRPVAMLLMIVASISFTIGISWEVIPVAVAVRQQSQVLVCSRWSDCGYRTHHTRRTFRRWRADLRVQKQRSEYVNLLRHQAHACALTTSPRKFDSDRIARREPPSPSRLSTNCVYVFCRPECSQITALCNLAAGCPNAKV
jgi:hypothetical protein